MDPAELSESAIIRKKKEIVDRSMEALEKGLKTWIETFDTATEQIKSGAKRSRDDHDDSSSEDQEGLASVLPNKAPKKRAKPDSDGPKFACPFYKHDTEKYKKVRTCLGPGWGKVHRVREHLMRKHKLPPHMCRRCCESFEDEAKLMRHQLVEVPCKIKKIDVPEGFNETQEAGIRKKSQFASGKERWEEMYRILFPEDEVPSPYQADAEEGLAVFDDAKPFKNAEEMKEYLLTEVPRLAKPIIQLEVDQLFKNMQVAMNGKVFEICQQVQNNVIQNLVMQRKERVTSDGETDDGGSGDSNSSSNALSNYPDIEELLGDVAYPFLDPSQLQFNFGQFLTPNQSSFVDNGATTTDGLVQDDSAYYSEERSSQSQGTGRHSRRGT